MLIPKNSAYDAPAKRCVKRALWHAKTPFFREKGVTPAPKLVSSRLRLLQLLGGLACALHCHQAVASPTTKWQLFAVVGPTASRMLLNEDYKKQLEQHKLRRTNASWNVSGGLCPHYLLTSFLSVGGGISYHPKGFEVVTADQQRAYRLRLHYLDFPVVVQLHPNGKRYGIHGYVGLQPSYLLNKSVQRPSTAQRSAPAYPKTFRNWDLGVVYGAGYSWHCGIAMRLQGSHSFLAINPHTTMYTPPVLPSMEYKTAPRKTAASYNTTYSLYLGFDLIKIL